MSDKEVAVVVMAIPVSEIRLVVADLDSVALQLGPAARKLYDELSTGLAKYDETGPHDSSYEIPILDH